MRAAWYGHQFMAYNAVIFDLFGTLVDIFSAEEYYAVLAEVAAVVGAPPDEFARLWAQGFEQRAIGAFGTPQGSIGHVCQLLGLQVDADRLAVATHIRLGLTRRNLAPRDDAIATLSALRAGGHRIGLISDCSPEVPALWEESPLAPFFDAAIFSCVVGLKKPDERIYRLACQRLEVAPQRCLYVGDGGSQELTGAAQVGMHPVLIRVPYEDADDAHRVDAEEWEGPTISALREVLTLVR